MFSLLKYSDYLFTYISMHHNRSGDATQVCEPEASLHTLHHSLALAITCDGVG